VSTQREIYKMLLLWGHDIQHFDKFKYLFCLGENLVPKSSHEMEKKQEVTFAIIKHDITRITKRDRYILLHCIC